VQQPGFPAAGLIPLVTRPFGPYDDRKSESPILWKGMFKLFFPSIPNNPSINMKKWRLYGSGTWL
jgi:hypothetical protein